MKTEIDIEVTVTEIIRQFGILAHIKGYRYLKRALILCTENSEMVIAATALLYPTLAAEFGTTSSRVASSISRAIGTAWNKGNREALNQYFNKTVLAKSRKPANAEFIAGISDRLRLKLKIKMQG